MSKKEDEIIQQLEKWEKDEIETILQKNAVNRFKRYSGELSAFLSSGFKVVTGPTWEEMTRQLFQIVSHAEGLWKDATALFEGGRYATACFLSIVCIEECAKIDFGRFQTYCFFVNNLRTDITNPQPSTTSQRRSPLTSHTMKHLLAACSGALVNSRMDRVLGIEKVASFISDCEKGKLEKLRQSCLYTDINQGEQRVLLPAEQISREQALFYVCLAGEILAEVGGIEPSTHERLLEKVDEFERANGINTSRSK